MNRIDSVFSVMAKKLVLVCFILFLGGCVSTDNNPDKQRAEIRNMRSDVIADLYQLSPQAREQLANSAGYAVFSNAQVNLIFLAAGGGYGVVKDNRTGNDTYMNMGEAGVGFGFGVKDFRAVFVFHTVEALNQFVNDGWVFGAEADAAVKASDKGKAASAGIAIGDITLYQLTEAGLALQATVKGTKYWKNDSLN